MFTLCTLVLFFIVANASPSRDNEQFQLNVVHLNDFHARFEETNESGGACKSDTCIGGISRFYEQVKNLRQKNPNLVLLNAGDNFQGTLWYSIHKWNVTQYFLNKFKFDAITLGNHEFDDGISGVVPFIKNMNAPTVVSNIDDLLEPDFQNIYSKSTIIERNGKKIGIIGVSTKTTEQISSPGKLKFLDESESVNAEAKRLVAEENVFTIIVLSHSGYEVDIEIAANAPEKVSLIVGGHSHTFLYTGEPTPGPDTPEGPYPTIVERSDGTVVRRKDGKSVLITQASAYCKYFGNINVKYDEDGEFVDWSGVPVFMDSNISQDDEINGDLVPWKEAVDAMGSKVLGNTLVDLNADCYTHECLLGDFVTDGYVHYWKKKAEPGSWAYASIAIMNAGGLRTTIEAGNITYNDLLTAQPFGNTADVSEIKGEHIKELLETAVSSEYFYGRVYASIKLIQVSGLKYSIDLSQPEGARIQSVEVLCAECSEPKYEKLDLEKTYRIITPSFLTTGGDGFEMLPKVLKNTVIGPLDSDLLTEFINATSPIDTKIEGRINIIGSKKIVLKNV